MYLDIFRAIENRHLLQMRYENYYRVVEPHVYGNIQGVDMLRAYQVAGYDGLKREIGWRWFNVHAIDGMTVLSARFYDERTGRPVLEGSMRRVYCQVI